jgi:hypothetical protein
VLRYLGEQVDARTTTEPDPDPDPTAEHDPELGSAP